MSGPPSSPHSSVQPRASPPLNTAVVRADARMPPGSRLPANRAERIWWPMTEASTTLAKMSNTAVAPATATTSVAP